MKRIGTRIGIILGLMLLSVVGYILLAGRDTPRPDDAELKLAWEQVPTAENAADFLLAATNMWWKRDTYKDSLDPLLNGSMNDPKLAQVVIGFNEPMIKVIEKAVTLPRCQVPEIKSISTPLPYLSEWRRIAKLIRLRGRMDLADNKPEDALKEAMLSIRMGDRIENCHGTILHYLVGLSIKHMGLRSLETILDTAKLPVESMRQTADELKTLGACDPGVQNALKMEYALACIVIDDVRAGRIGMGNLGFDNLTGLAARLPMRYLLQSNRTRRLFADYYLQVIPAVIQPLKNARENIPEIEDIWTPKNIIYKPNGVGRMLYAQMLPGIATLAERRAGEQLYVEAIRLRLLLKAHEAETGELPDALSSLSPDHLDSVPMDPYDGKPLRYNRDRRILYSVGRDLEDSGGSEKLTDSHGRKTLSKSQKRWLTEDIVFNL